MSHFFNVRCEFWLLRDYCTINIRNAITFFKYIFHCLFKQNFAVNILVRIVIIGKKFAYITERSGTKKRIANCVKKHIGIGMSEKSFGVWDFHAAQKQLSAVAKTVHVISVAYSHFYHSLLIIPCALTISSGVVIFILSGSPSTIFVFSPINSITEVSSVKSVRSPLLQASKNPETPTP